MFHSNSIGGSWVVVGLLLGACSGSVEPDDGAARSGAQHENVGASSAALTNPAACPVAERKLFVVYYGLSTTEYDRIIAKHPAIVVLGDHKGSGTDTTPAYFHNADASIRVLAYIPMNYGGSGVGSSGTCPLVNGVDGACANTPKSFDCTAVAITTRIQNAMAVGYDGVFFDETPTNKPNYVQNCAALVKNAGGQKIVTMNPGAVPAANMLSDNVDIVSVENQYTADLRGFGVRSARFMAEQGGVSDAATALSRLNTFRVNGAYWYYATSSYSATLPAWFEAFADAVNATTDEPHDCGSNPVHVAFRTYQNVAGNPEITGLWSVVTDSTSTQQTGFSPKWFTVPTGTASVNFGDYSPYFFNHWDDASTARPRSINVTGNRRVNGFYDIR
jgi:spherulation-specific family 4 protein